MEPACRTLDAMAIPIMEAPGTVVPGTVVPGMAMLGIYIPREKLFGTWLVLNCYTINCVDKRGKQV